MNYQSIARELTLISKKYLEFFKDNNDVTVEYNLVKSFNYENKKLGQRFQIMRIKRFFLIIVFLQ